jgi:hypothetical protein
VVLEYNKENASITGLMHGQPQSSLDLSLIEIVWSLGGLLQTQTYGDYKAALVGEAHAVSKEACWNVLAGIQKKLQL